MELPLGFTLLLVFGLVVFMLFIGMWVAFALAAVGLVILVWLAGGAQSQIGQLLFNSLNDFVVVAVPMYVFLGELILRSGLSERLYRGVSKWTGIIPGGLTHSNIMACSIFAAVSGSSVATAATIGTVALKEQESRGYDGRLVMGSIAAGGTLGILIPPSITMILYGAFQQVPVGRLFIGGVFPGILMALLFMTWIGNMAIVKPHWSPGREKFTLSYFPRALSAFKDVWSILLLILIIMGSIYTGVATPSEAAAVATVVTFIIMAIYRRLTPYVVWDAARASIATSTMVLFILVGARVLSTGMSMIKLPRDISDWVLSFDVGTYVIWGAIVIMYLVLGCFMDGISLMLLTLPVTYPLVVEGLGFDRIWFGVLLTILIEAALITPPVGLNLYVIHGISGGKRFGDVVQGVIPFFFIMLIVIGILTAFPDIVTWLPSTMFTRGGR